MLTHRTTKISHRVQLNILQLPALSITTSYAYDAVMWLTQRRVAALLLHVGRTSTMTFITFAEKRWQSHERTMPAAGKQSSTGLSLRQTAAVCLRRYQITID